METAAPARPVQRAKRGSLPADVLEKPTRYDHATCLVTDTIVRAEGEVQLRVGERALTATPPAQGTLPEVGELAHAVLWPRTDDTGRVAHWRLGKAQRVDVGTPGLLALSVCGTLTHVGPEAFTVRVTPNNPKVPPFEVTCRAHRTLSAALPEVGCRLLVRGGVADGALMALRMSTERRAPPVDRTVPRTQH